MRGGRLIFPRLQAQFDEDVWEQLRSGTFRLEQVKVLLQES
jgi:hypothetical protein